MANRSLNQFRRELETFAATHGQLQTVAFNKQNDLLDNGDVRYPAFYYTLNRARKTNGLLSLSFTGWVADMMLKEKPNEAEIWSDTLLIAADLLAFMSGDDREYSLSDATDLRNFSDAEGDLLAGVSFDFTVNLPYVFDRCLIPEKPEGSGFLMSEDGRYFITESGQRIRLDTVSGTLIYAESGDPLITEDGQTIILE